MVKSKRNPRLIPFDRDVMVHIRRFWQRRYGAYDGRFWQSRYDAYDDVNLLLIHFPHNINIDLFVLFGRDTI